MKLLPNFLLLLSNNPSASSSSSSSKPLVTVSTPKRLSSASHRLTILKILYQYLHVVFQQTNHNMFNEWNPQKSLVSPVHTLDLWDFGESFVSILIEYWLECSPSEQNVSLEENHVESMQWILRLFHIFFHGFNDKDPHSRDQQLLRKFLPQFRKHFFVHFPFASLSGNAK